MCGIAGFVSTGYRTALERALRAMTAAQVHRGPDDGGIAMLPAGPGGFAGLGSRRLAIIDRSGAGRQPMTSRAGNWIVFNGEIYNFAALRTALAGAGYAFRSRTDTEVLLHGYDQWGIEDLLRRLRGMFAFAIWDSRRRRLILARDRLGEKPLYYAFAGRRLIFASELRAILAAGLTSCSLSPAGLYAYMALGSVPAPLTIADPVRALEPGHYAILAGGRLELTRYWSIEMAASEPLTSRLTAAGAAEHLRAIVTEAVAARMAGDTPIGLLLSGGIDSSAVLAAMPVTAGPSLRAHTLVFPDEAANKAGDEAPFARIAARRAGAELFEHPLRAGDLASELPKLAAAIDQPSIDGINMYFVAKFARAAGTVVALTGLGGDELFGGYSSFTRVPLLLRAGLLWRACGPAGRALARVAGLGQGSSRGARLRAFLNGEPTRARAWFALRGLFDDASIARLIDPELARAGSRQFDTFSYLHGLSESAADTAGAVSLLELQAYMHNQLLRDTDVMSMAHGVEIRSPLIDHELVEFVAALPSQWKFGGRPKALLLRAFEGLIPPVIANRPKVGFTLPFGRWLRDDLSATIRASLDDADGITDPAGTRALWQDFQRGRLHWSRLWAIVILRQWLREFRVMRRPAEPVHHHVPALALVAPPPASA